MVRRGLILCLYLSWLQPMPAAAHDDAPPLTGAGAERPSLLILGLAVLALALTAVNMFGGFAVTRRMLAMFRK